jgi:N-acetylmuramic acid 6-phosphate (MurNAc-6-P) etherase
MDAAPRVTELSNPLTAGLSSASPDGFIRMLAACDSQLFTGSHGLPCAHDFAGALARAAEAIAAALRHPRGHIVFGGCGTSGRLAHLLAAVYNDAAASALGGGRRAFHYLLAGGDAALLIPAESVEDSAAAGVADYAAWEARCGVAVEDPVVLVGISCGLSATYVAALLAAGAARRAVLPVALGFNDVTAVRAVAVPGAGVTFHGVLQALLEAGPEHALVINPVVGPEAVAGSSRMKGGSATWILLAAACEEALAAAREGGAAPAAASIKRRLIRAEAAVRALYSGAGGALAAAVRAGAAALAAPPPPAAAAAAAAAAPGGPAAYVPAPAASGRIFYVGAGAAGLLGLVDASEATDTYGSAFGDLRGFLARGWAAAAVGEGAADPEVPLELRGRGPGGAPPPAGHARASPCLSSFFRDVAPTLAAGDAVVALWVSGGGGGGGGGEGGDDAASDGFQLLRALAAARERGAAALAIAVEGAPPDARARAFADALLAAAPGGGVRAALWELAPPAGAGAGAGADAAPWAPLLALKLALNALSTGAHVLGRGVVLGNRMGNMMLTNHKLFLRAEGIVEGEAGVPRAAAAAALLRAVHGWPRGSPELAAAEEEAAREGSTAVLRHVAAAALVERVIPTALLLAAAEREGRALAAEEARAALQREPRVQLAARALGLASVGRA